MPVAVEFDHDFHAVELVQHRRDGVDHAAVAFHRFDPAVARDPGQHVAVLVGRIGADFGAVGNAAHVRFAAINLTHDGFGVVNR